jgi:hypothetical protein
MARDSGAPPAPEAKTDAFRQQMLAKVPGWYSPYGHLAGTVGIGVAAVCISLSALRAPRLLELVTIPIAFVFANLIEWLAHKHLMHRRRRLLPVLFDRHTPEHHRAYRHDTMAIRDPRELRLVLIPAMGVLGIVLLATPAAFAASLVANENVGWLFLLTAATYVVGYELTHLCYHLPESSVVYRIPLVRALREHHAGHHVPGQMQRFNFNVTIPLFDLIFGTIAPRNEKSNGAQAPRN